jgi:hypothetical protein
MIRKARKGSSNQAMVARNHTGGNMRFKLMVIAALIFATAVPAGAGGKKKGQERGMLEKMEAVPCGAKQKGLSGIGGIWASIGVTDVHNTENLCPQYLLRTDEMDYHIRPTDRKHPVVLPVGEEVEFKIKNDKLYLKSPDGDKKTRTYQVVAMDPAHPPDNSNPPSASSKSPGQP